MIAAVHNIKNRMLRNRDKRVAEDWQGYNHKPYAADPSGELSEFRKAQEIAVGVLNGTLADPTNGATHFYSPQSMRKEGEPVKREDIGGGLEDVPGVHARHSSQHVRNYRPVWSITPSFTQNTVPGILDREFKFYKQKDNTGRVL